jgi:hypothetical protein
MIGRRRVAHSTSVLVGIHLNLTPWSLRTIQEMRSFLGILRAQCLVAVHAHTLAVTPARKGRIWTVLCGIGWVLIRSTLVTYMRPRRPFCVAFVFFATRDS